MDHCIGHIRTGDSEVGKLNRRKVVVIVKSKGQWDGFQGKSRAWLL